MKDMAEDLRPREKALRYGFGTLAKHELLAIIIGGGTVGESVLSLSQRILADNDNRFDVLIRKSVAELVKTYRGVGEAKAVAILAAANIGRIFGEELDNPREAQQMNSSEKGFSLMRHVVGNRNVEEFWIITLSRSLKVINLHRVSMGGVANTLVDKRVLFNYAVADLASAIILCHNHPAGAIKPSIEDRNLTRAIVEAGKLLDIQVLDHIIVGDNKYYSFKDEGDM